MQYRKIRPKKVRLEASLNCQLRCPLCSTEKEQAAERGIGYLKIDDFKTFLANNPDITKVELAGHAEIFLNPNLLEIIQYSHKNNIELTANAGVNLNYISDEVCESLAKYKFRSIICSIDVASQETYEIYRIGGYFNKVIRNIERINFYKNKYKTKFPLLHWQFIIFGHNEHEIRLAKKLAKKLNMGFTVQLSWDPLWSPLKNKNSVMKEIRLPFADINDYNEKKKVRLIKLYVRSYGWIRR